MHSRLSTRATTIKVTAASVTAAVVLTGGLAVQMAAGHDPALGSGTAKAQSPRKAANAAPVNVPPQPSVVVTRSS